MRTTTPLFRWYTGKNTGNQVYFRFGIFQRSKIILKLMCFARQIVPEIFNFTNRLLGENKTIFRLSWQILVFSWTFSNKN